MVEALVAHDALMQAKFAKFHTMLLYKPCLVN